MRGKRNFYSFKEKKFLPQVGQIKKDLLCFSVLWNCHFVFLVPVPLGWNCKLVSSTWLHGTTIWLLWSSQSVSIQVNLTCTSGPSWSGVMFVPAWSLNPFQVIWPLWSKSIWVNLAWTSSQSWSDVTFVPAWSMNTFQVSLLGSCFLTFNSQCFISCVPSQTEVSVRRQ